MSQQAIIELVRLAESDETVLGELQAADTLEEKGRLQPNMGVTLGFRNWRRL
jgi:hypothetical protein